LDLLVLSLDDVELLTSDSGSTDLELVDKFTVVERKLNVSNFDVSESWFSVLRFSLEADCDILGKEVSVEVFLDLLLKMHLQAKAWRDTLAIWAIFCHVAVLKPFAVGILEDHPLDGVVASGDGGHVPLHLLDLSTLIQVSDLDHEEQTDKNAHATHVGSLLCLCLQSLL